jgi:antitoxin PrlF
MKKTYTLRNTKIGNSNGFRLPTEFYRENPQFAAADGWIEVVSDTTAIIRIEPPITADEDDDEIEDSLMMRLFLDFALSEALKNKDLVPYTVERSEAIAALVEGVEVDDD